MIGTITYAQAFADHQYLWKTYAPASDMTGGYVDSYDLKKLLASPTKATARDCLSSQIRYWMAVGPEDCTADRAVLRGLTIDMTVTEIADRHGVSEEYIGMVTGLMERLW